MDAEKLLFAIRHSIHEYKIKHPAVAKIGVVISSKNLQILVDNTKQSTNIQIPDKVQSIELFGCRVYPSDFIEDKRIIVSQKTELML